MGFRRTLMYGGFSYGVSELVSSLIVLLITIALGSIVIISINNYSYDVATLFKSDIERKATDSVRSLDLVMTSGSKSANTIKLVISNGIVRTRIIAVYVNDVPIQDLAVTLEPLEIIVLEFRSPVELSEGNVFRVKVVYEGSEGTIYGYTYR
ncbi:MAG: hypothetical protein QXZ10_01900 [Sulfolobales archaeon]